MRRLAPSGSTPRRNGKGKLTRVGIIGLAMLMLNLYCDAQVMSLRGELRYEHQYQDFLPEGGSLSTSLRQGPALNLNLLGNVLSKRILAYSLFTSLATSFGSSHTSIYSFSNTQYNWNAYNVIVNVLPYSSAKLDLSARENMVDTKSAYDIISTRSRLRQQEQRIALSVEQVPALPTMSLSYTRNRSWAPIGESSEQLSHQYSFALSSSSGSTAAVSLSGSLNDVAERYTGFHERLLSLNLTGSKQFSERHRLNINSDYNQYSAYSNLTGSVGYNGQFGDRLRLSSGVSAVSYSSANALGRTGGLTEGIAYTLDQNFQLGLNFSGTIGSSKVVSSNNIRTYLSTNWEGRTSVQHTRLLGTMTVTNGFSVGYLVQQYIDRYTTFSSSFSNGVQLPVGMFAASGDYTFSYSTTQNSGQWAVIGNNVGIVVGGTLPEQIKSNTSVRYRDDHYSGDNSSFRDQQNLLLSQRFDGSFVYVIPFTLGVGGSVNWYFASVKGHTHAWYISLNSPGFFLRGLFANYVYTRNFDPYFHQEVVEHNGSLLYQWRALSFQLRYRHAIFPIRVRDVMFTVSRPF